MNGRLYRGSWLLVALPLLLLAFSVARPPSLQLPGLPNAFDRGAAAALAHDFASHYPDRVPGTPTAAGATAWFGQQLRPYGFHVVPDTFTATVDGRTTALTNLVVEKPGLSSREIVVMAHRDDSGTGNGLDDNASGTAALIELARSYAPTAAAQRNSLPYSLVFVSTDGAEQGALGAAHFAAEAATRLNAIAVINLDSVAGTGRPRLEFAGDTPRSPAPGLLETMRAALATESGGAAPGYPSGFRQLLALGFPFTVYEQAPFVSAGIPVVTVTTGGARPPAATRHGTLDVTHLGEIGLATQETIDAMEEGVALAQGPTNYVFLGQRLVRGWAVELVLAAMLLPFIASAVDLLARCRRRRIRIAPALRSYRSRLAFWLWVGAVFLVFAAFGFWGSGPARPPALDSVSWPAGTLIVLALLAAIGWLVARERLLPRGQVSTEELLAGHTAALLALSVVGLLVAATNPFALVFLLPCLHVWLWLPQVQSREMPVRAGVFLLGFAGPALLVWLFAVQYGLGWDAPWYLAKLFAVGYAPRTLLVIGLGWLAAAGQLVAIAVNRYAPYPGPSERPRRGPIRDLIRTLLLAQRRRALAAGGKRAVQ